MKKNSISQSGLFNPRVLLAFALCSVGVLLAMLSFAATPPVEVPHANTSLPPDPANFLSTFGSNANRRAAVATFAEEALPPGVPLSVGALNTESIRGQFSVNGQGDPSSNRPTTGLPGFAGMPIGPGMASGAHSLANPVLAKQQSVPLSVPRPAARTPNAFGAESMPLASAQNGWSIVSSPNTSTTQDNVLLGGTCVSASECWVAGYYFNGSVAQTLIERWDGSSWAIVSSPNTSAAQNNLLTGVACASAAECWAVGYTVVQGLPETVDQTLIERWDGASWTIVTSPKALTTQSNVLSGVTCVSATECWAVGYSPFNGSVYQTLIERWDGASWTIVSSPNALTAESNLLLGVTCASATECWAIGYSYNLAGTIFQTLLPAQTLIERWDGTAWAVVSSPDSSATQSNYLGGVTCVSAAECWAVGYYITGGIPQTLLEGWDGTSWAIVSSPNNSTTHTNFLSGVTCTSASNCWAIGWYSNGSADQTLLERWDGTSWAIVSSPNVLAAPFNFLQSVTCASATECWAFGYYYYIGSSQQTLIEHYTVPAVQLVEAVSRKVHGSAGAFDVDLTGGNAIECRSGGTNGDYQLVFSFANTLTNVGGVSVASGGGSIVSGNIDSSDAHNYVVNLTGVTNAQVITVSLTNVTDSTGGSSPSLSASMGVLIGDTNADGLVNSADIGQTKSKSGQGVDQTNFREDLNTDGFLNSADIGLVKSKSGTGLP